MSDTLIACCPDCGWNNNGRLRACIAFDTAFTARPDAWRLFAEGEVDADCDEDGRGILCDVSDCPSCELDSDNIAEWIGAAFMRLTHSILRMESEADALDAIAREEAETMGQVGA